MAETCIVCLSTLRQQGQSSPSQAAPSPEVHAKRSLRNTRLTSKSIDDDQEIVARLLPCKHILHNACLKPWVERANSCPTCRATFNTVELSATVDGDIIDTYAVKDKVQEVVYDETITIFPPGEDDLLDDVDFDAATPCIICQQVDESHEVMYCDGCDATVHVFCSGYDNTPDIWHCADCTAGMGRIETMRQRPMGTVRRRQQRHADLSHPQNDRAWARVWQEVSRRLDFDLDFPFPEEEEQRTREQRREFESWQRRFAVADRQGTAHRLRHLTARLYQPPAPRAQPQPAQDSEEVVRAWNAFEKARESQEDPQPRRKRPRSDSPTDDAATEHRQLKRPRLRRPPANADNHIAESTATDDNLAESSNAAVQRAADEPTFLSSLLREVEQNPVSAASPGASTGQRSPRDLSPARSTSPSGQVTPRAHSMTPPPSRLPASPPLSSTIMPPQSPPGFTFTPLPPRPLDDIKRHQRGRAHVRPNGVLNHGFYEIPAKELPPATSPRPLSLASKEEIQRMVKLALAPRYRDKEITKDQYTDINRDVSRRLYDLVGDAAALSDEKGRAKWQQIAESEVEKAIAACDKEASTAEAQQVEESKAKGVAVLDKQDGNLQHSLDSSPVANISPRKAAEVKK